MNPRHPLVPTLGLFLLGILLLGATDNKQAPPIPKGEPKGKDAAPMVLIPEGAFTMGTDDIGLGWHQGNPNENPEHAVTLKAYWIDQFELTVTHYEKFIEETRHDPPMWEEDASAAAGDRPVVGVTWQDAVDYCKWAGKRLPTEAEWEKAARGTDKRRFPWGEMQPFVDIVNYNRGLWVSYPITLVSVTSGLEGMSIRHGLKTGGTSPYGLYHMSGNASEWVADWYDAEYYRKSPKENPTGPAQGDKKVIRGGSWNDPPRNLRVTYRLKASPDYQDSTIGFRCAMDATR